MWLEDEVGTNRDKLRLAARLSINSRSVQHTGQVPRLTSIQFIEYICLHIPERLLEAGRHFFGHTPYL